MSLALDVGKLLSHLPIPDAKQVDAADMPWPAIRLEPIKDPPDDAPLPSLHNLRLSRHCLKEAIGIYQFDWRVKKAAEVFTGEDLRFLTVRYHLTAFEKYDA